MQTTETSDIINTSNISTKYGVLAGIGMSLILLLFQLSGNDFSPFLKLGKYIVLAVVITFALKKYSAGTNADIFIKGIGIGTKLSLVAALVMVAANVLLYAITPTLAFSKYSIEPTTLGEAGLVSGILFFETFVFGSLTTFAVLQFLKRRIAV